ncbi:MAG: methionyl-tRNA formyltransferase [Thermaerobacter sp.]|nr:methionyl-tRNA formyltransferase [Thermaerobacter sp.]
MRLVFLGTPEFAVPALSAVHAHHEVVLVVTAPPRPRGRGQKPAATPVESAAQALSIQVETPDRLDDAAVRRIEQARPDAICVVAYGKMLPESIFERWTCLNVHPSLLPRHRGAAPIPWTIWSGDKLGGVTIMRIVKQLDAGPIFLQEGFRLSGEETAGDLLAETARRGADLLATALAGLQQGDLPEHAQEGESTYARMLRQEDERLDLDRPAVELARQVRALSPRPGVRVTTQERGLELRLLRAAPAAGAAPRGELRAHGEQLAIGCGEGLLLVSELQPAGGRAQSAADFLRGRPWAAGLRVR